MKVLFENWRRYLNERFEPLPKPLELPSAGESFPTMGIQEIILQPTKDTIKKIALLNIFNQLEDEPDDSSNIKHILYSLYTMSGNSPDFKFKSKDEALKFYTMPYQYKAHSGDSEPTKSLQEWHKHLKVISSRNYLSRGQDIKDFYKKETVPYEDTETPISKTIVAPRRRPTPTIKGKR